MGLVVTLSAVRLREVSKRIYAKNILIIDKKRKRDGLRPSYGYAPESDVSHVVIVIGPDISLFPASSSAIIIMSCSPVGSDILFAF